jgi:hypothetical protein
VHGGGIPHPRALEMGCFDMRFEAGFCYHDPVYTKHFVNRLELHGAIDLMGWDSISSKVWVTFLFVRSLPVFEILHCNIIIGSPKNNHFFLEN